MLGAVAARQIKLANPSADSSRLMMVLAVDIVGDSPTERHKLRPRRNGQEIAGRDYKFENFRQANAGLGDKKAAGPVEADEAVEAGHLDQGAAVIEAAVAIGTPQPAGQQAVGRLGALFATSGTSSSRKGRTRDAHLGARSLPHGRMSVSGVKPFTSPTGWRWRPVRRARG